MYENKNKISVCLSVRVYRGGTFRKKKIVTGCPLRYGYVAEGRKPAPITLPYVNEICGVCDFFANVTEKTAAGPLAFAVHWK